LRDIEISKRGDGFVGSTHFTVQTRDGEYGSYLGRLRAQQLAK
jgi:hypothetical protein